jgi:hypothetical protein
MGVEERLDVARKVQNVGNVAERFNLAGWAA